MTINCKGTIIDLAIPRVMGILNVTPDSFFDGGKYKHEDEIVRQVEQMLYEGATFIDVGAYSSRPQAAFVSEDEELSRILPLVGSLVKKFPKILLSIDTFRSGVAQACLDHGAALVNDIAAGSLDEKMFEVVARYNVPYIMMHTRGTPQDMHLFTDYEHLINEMLYYFSEKINKARSFGIADCIIDPGFGFAKTLQQNFEILHKLDLFKILEVPILAGVSRKSMIYKPLGCTPQEALNGTTVVNTLCVVKGAGILRVHDVKEAMEVIKLATF